MADAPISAPARRSDTLRTVSNPSRRTLRPPGRRIDGFSILAELHIELRRVTPTLESRCACHPGFSHRRHRLPCQHRLAERHADSAQSRENDMITVARIEYQE